MIDHLIDGKTDIEKDGLVERIYAIGMDSFKDGAKDESIQVEFSDGRF